MSESEQSETPSKELSFPLFYLAKKPSYKSTEVLAIASGPFVTEDEAISFGHKKYGWAISDYCVLVSEQKFQIAKISLGS